MGRVFNCSHSWERGFCRHCDVSCKVWNNIKPDEPVELSWKTVTVAGELRAVVKTTATPIQLKLFGN